VWLALLSAGVQGQEKKPEGKGIDAATVAAYEKLGAKYGGWGKADDTFQPGQKYAESGLPGFELRTFPEGKLPDVAVPFGLMLMESDVTDAGLKQVSTLKNLTRLNLFLTNVTDVGLQELAKLRNLTELDLYNARVTDAGLKELSGLVKL